MIEGRFASRTDKSVMRETALKQIPTKMAPPPRSPVRREEDYRGGKTMRIASRGMAITIAALSLAASALAAPVETVLYSFKGGSDGAGPIAGLIADKEGALCGTTQNGGTGNGDSGFGTVFKLTPPTKGQTAWTETALYRFTGGSDGGDVFAGLIADKEGALYGTTQGVAPSNGTVFKLTPPAKGQTTWNFTLLYGFCSHPQPPGCSDGAAPRAGLIADNQGALYGTTLGGGTASNGTVFKLTPPAQGASA
jgi:uncharacterized repeat protein (TIGR03803 family)